MRLMTSTAQTQLPRQRRHVDSAAFWVTLLAASVSIHLLLLIAGRLLSPPVASTSNSAPIAVDIVPVNSSTPASSPTTRATSIASANPTREVPSTARSTTPVSSSATTDPEFVTPRSRSTPITPKPESPQQTPVTRSPQARSPQTPFNPRTNPDNPATNSPANPATDPPVNPTNSEPTNPTPTSSESVNRDQAAPPGPAESGEILPAPTTVPNAGKPDYNSPLASNNQAPISQNPVPAEFSASIVGVELATGSDPVPTYPPTPDAVSPKRFVSDGAGSGCLLTPEVLGNFGQEVELSIAIDATGTVGEASSPTVQRSSGNESYDQLAICAIKTWKFNPAYDIENGVKAEKPSNLDVRVVINSELP